jgi:hypothetical protein
MNRFKNLKTLKGKVKAGAPPKTVAKATGTDDAKGTFEKF